MSDQFGFIEGAKSVTSSMDASREASKSITKSITDVQKDAGAAAQQKDLERKRQIREAQVFKEQYFKSCLLYTSPSPRDLSTSRMPSSA